MVNTELIRSIRFIFYNHDKIRMIFLHELRIYLTERPRYLEEFVKDFDHIDNTRIDRAFGTGLASRS